MTIEIKKVTLKRQLAYGFLAALVIIAFLGGIKFLHIRKAIADHANFAMPPEAVTTTVAAKQSWPDLFSATADLTATQGIMLKNELPGRVSNIPVTPGQEVKAGDLLIALDTSNEKADLMAAQAEMTRADKEYKRTLTLQEAKALSQGALDIAYATYSQARAKVDGLNATLQKKNITAPFAGTVGMRGVNVGEILDTGRELMPLQTMDSLFLNFSLPQRALPLIKQGASISFTVDAYPDQNFSATLSSINPQVEMTTRLVKLQAVYNNQDRKLKPGMFASVVLDGEKREDFITIPATSVQYSPYATTVYVVETKKADDGKESKTAASVPVKLGSRRGDQVAIVSGLVPGQEVITSGVFKLRPGISVAPTSDFKVGDSAKPTPADT